MPAATRATARRPRRAPLQERSRETVDTILSAAAHVFASLGYAGATTNKIAERAGVSIGSLYQYFPNKDSLLDALMAAHVQEGEDLLAQHGAAAFGQQSDLSASVRQLVRTMVELHARDRALHRVLFEEAPLSRAMRRRIESIEARVTALVEQYLRLVIRPPLPDPGLAAAIVVQTVEGLTHRLVVHGHGTTDVDRWVEEISTLILRYLTPPR